MSSTGGFFKGCRALMAAAKAATPKPSAAVKTTSAILKPAPISPALRQFLGAPEAARTEAVKKVWEYIKIHNLQNPVNKREILCDDKLKTIFEGKDKVGMLEIAKLLSNHFVKTP
ncbi:Upstream activation factor subunit spp27 like [Actinidia chinensis var. chinensis]|uniref:Upstream activation factor subunit spp27 like n=1 Tax=Actinidia chinensis var. chinensis TaxID=1590841 RepID=A0A2R6RAF5_ACTCC|nr:Upstream activation factor subunit spp27 like [Actinidia chinensis var. chinensis]